MSALSRPVCNVSWAVALTLPVLTGCGSKEDAFAPVCPRPAILRDAANLQRYRGAGRDFLDTTLQGRIVSISGSCKQDTARGVAVSVNVGIELTRGPAAVGRAAEIAFFVAVSEGERVLDKQVYPVQAAFPENTDRLKLAGDSVDLVLPVSATKKADAYQITVGFQLTPAEVAITRAARTPGG